MTKVAQLYGDDISLARSVLRRFTLRSRLSKYVLASGLLQLSGLDKKILRLVAISSPEPDSDPDTSVDMNSSFKIFTNFSLSASESDVDAKQAAF